MKSARFLACLAIFLGIALTGYIDGTNGNPTLELNIQMVQDASRIEIAGATGAVSIEYAANLDQDSKWTLLATVLATNSPSSYTDTSITNAEKRFYRALVENNANTNAPAKMALIPAGSFQMGDALDNESALTLHKVYVSAFHMDKNLVTKELWNEVKTWARTNGYSFDNVESGKAADHPVHTVNWYDVVKWCNARSEKEGRVAAYYTSAAMTKVYRSGEVNLQNDWVKWNAGYRLPTEAEWEKAARGGLSGNRFPWGNTVTHSQANYYCVGSFPYDLSTTKGYHPSYYIDPLPYTSPVGSFDPNGFGLYDMAGNVSEWCWDMIGSYSSDSQTDPHGPNISVILRVIRGGNWINNATYLRCASRSLKTASLHSSDLGFRCALSQP